MAKKMSLEVADVIRLDWAKFLEITHGNLMTLFFTKIPESFLPYPKDTIEEALNVVAEHFHSQGNINAVKSMQSGSPFLYSYVPDKEAIEQAIENWGNKKFIEAVSPHLGELQKKQLQRILDKYK